jgi:hypothetical protein
MVSFISDLGAEDVEAFWPGYAANQKATASSFLLLLVHTGASAGGCEDSVEEMGLVKDWRDVLKNKERDMKGVVGRALEVVEAGWGFLPVTITDVEGKLGRGGMKTKREADEDV